MLVGDGANRFAAQQGIERVPQYRLITQAAIDALENYLNNSGGPVTELGY